MYYNDILSLSGQWKQAIAPNQPRDHRANNNPQFTVAKLRCFISVLIILHCCNKILDAINLKGGKRLFSSQV
jgi:hypothetical protein